MYVRVLFFDRIKQYFMPYNQSKYQGFNFFARLSAAAFVSMTFQTILTYPLDLIQTRIMADMSTKKQNRLFQTTFDCFNRTLLDEGNRRALYKGSEVAIFSGVLRGVLVLPLYDYLKVSNNMVKNTFMRKNDSYLQKFWERVGPAFISSLLISSLLYPLDTLKRNMQLNESRGYVIQYKNVFDCILKLRQHYGIGGFYRGMWIF